jgi:hypothetical protein
MYIYSKSDENYATNLQRNLIIKISTFFSIFLLYVFAQKLNYYNKDNNPSKFQLVILNTHIYIYPPVASSFHSSTIPPSLHSTSFICILTQTDDDNCVA